MAIYLSRDMLRRYMDPWVRSPMVSNKDCCCIFSVSVTVNSSLFERMNVCYIRHTAIRGLLASRLILNLSHPIFDLQTLLNFELSQPSFREFRPRQTSYGISTFELKMVSLMAQLWQPDSSQAATAPISSAQFAFLSSPDRAPE